MFGTRQKFDLKRPAYGRRGTGFYLYEDFYEHVLRLSCYKSGEMSSRSPFQFDIRLFSDGTELDYTYFADEASLRADCKAGYAEFALTDADHVRIRGNMELRLCLRPAIPEDGTKACRGLVKLANGEWEGAFGQFGMLRIRAMAGNVEIIAPWNDQAGAYDEVTFRFLPENGLFEAAIFENMTEFDVLPRSLPSFEEVKTENRRSFEEFKTHYKQAPDEFKELANYAMWLIWSHTTKTTGGYKEPMVMMHYQWFVAAISWQQSYNAMAMQNDPKEAWRLLCTMFEHQSQETGALAFAVSYLGSAIGGSPQPPFQGLALAFLYDIFGEDLFTYDGCAYLYPKYKKWLDFWFTRRSARRGDDVTAVLSSHEAGWDDASIFNDGFPAENPDVMAYIALGMEGMSRMARVLHLYAEAEDWMRRSKKLIHTIVTEYWDGDKFITRVHGKPVESMSLVCYQPIILGYRLPQHIIDKVAEKVTDERLFLSPYGVTGESMMSPLSGYGNRFILGRVVAPLNMMISVGLSSAGKTKEAALIARRFCKHCDEVGCLLGFAPYDYYPLTGEKVPDLDEFENMPVPSDGWPWATWSACNIMTMLTYVLPRENMKGEEK
jgi:putative isomerase